MLKAKLIAVVLLCLSATVAVLAATAGSASALGLYGCKEVGASSLGVYTESHCATTTSHGSWTWTWADENGETTDYCLLELTDPSFKNSICTEGSSGGAFEAVKLPDELYFLLSGVTENADAQIFKGMIGGVTTEVLCTHASFTGRPFSRVLLSSTAFRYSGCTVKAPESCSVDSAHEETGKISTTELVGTLASSTKMAFAPHTGTTYLELSFTGATCVIAGKAEVTGKQNCRFSAGVSTPAAEHQFLCEASGSEFLNGQKSGVIRSQHQSEVRR